MITLHIFVNWLVDWTRSLRNAVFALCLLKCVFIKMLLWFSDLESSKLCPFCVSLFPEFLFLGLLGVTQHSIVIPLCPILRCHPLLLSASPSEGIYAPFINGSFRTLCCFTNNFCAYVAPQPRSSRNPRPLQGARPVGQGGHTSLTSRRRTCCWAFLPHVPQ